MTATRRLVLMRHASAETLASSDAGRALSQRGREEAAEMGRWLADLGIRPDAALVSAALRTQQTWAGVSTAAGWGVTAEFSEALYSAGPESALDLIRGTDPTVSSLLVIGHNPTVEYLAHMLDDRESDAGRTAGFSPGTVGVLDLPGEWADAAYLTGRLVAQRSPS